LQFQNFDKNENIGERSIYVIDQLICLGGTDIAQEGSEILPNVSPKL